jgi:hypothetical protein
MNLCGHLTLLWRMKNRRFYSQLNHFVPGPEKRFLMRASSLSCMSTWQQTWPETQRISLLPRRLIISSLLDFLTSGHPFSFSYVEVLVYGWLHADAHARVCGALLCVRSRNGSGSLIFLESSWFTHICFQRGPGRCLARHDESFWCIRHH